MFDSLSTSKALEARLLPASGVFIVEDHEAMRRALRQLLVGADLNVTGEAGSAEEALERLPGLKPALILVDLSLPGLSGLDLVRQVQRIRPELNCLVITGHTDPIYRTSALAAGACDYMTKDDPDEILAAVLRCLASSVANSG